MELNGVFRFVLFCFSFCFVFGGPGGGFGGPGGGFLGSSKSSGKATTETIKKKAATRTTKTTPRTTEDKTKRKTKQNKTKNTVQAAPCPPSAVDRGCRRSCHRTPGPWSGISIIIIALQLLPFPGLPVVGFGPKSAEMNPSAFPDLPIQPRTVDFDQKMWKIARKNQDGQTNKKGKSPYYCLILPNSN